MPNPKDDEEIRLSPSIASILCRKSALHAWQAHRLLGGEQAEPTKTMERGKILEALIFNHDKDKIVVVDADSWRTKEAKEKRDAAREARLVPVLAHEFEEYRLAVDQIGPQLAATGFEFDGMNQEALLWESDGVLCKGYADHWIKEKGLIVDLKCVEDASPDHCARAFVEYGYSIQWAAYTEAIVKRHPELAGRVRMVFLFCEVNPPYAVTVAEPDGSMQELGKAQWKRAVETWGRCMKTGTWPGYSQNLVKLAAKPWHLDFEMMQGQPQEEV